MYCPLRTTRATAAFDFGELRLVAGEVDQGNRHAGRQDRDRCGQRKGLWRGSCNAPFRVNSRGARLSQFDQHGPRECSTSITSALDLPLASRRFWRARTTQPSTPKRRLRAADEPGSTDCRSKQRTILQGQPAPRASRASRVTCSGTPNRVLSRTSARVGERRVVAARAGAGLRRGTAAIVVTTTRGPVSVTAVTGFPCVSVQRLQQAGPRDGKQSLGEIRDHPSSRDEAVAELARGPCRARLPGDPWPGSP
jgi:hypothetical protein